MDRQNIALTNKLAYFACFLFGIFWADWMAGLLEILVDGMLVPQIKYCIIWHNRGWEILGLTPTDISRPTLISGSDSKTGTHHNIRMYSEFIPRLISLL
jgi:hypothetical protein